MAPSGRRSTFGANCRSDVGRRCRFGLSSAQPKRGSGQRVGLRSLPRDTPLNHGQPLAPPPVCVGSPKPLGSRDSTQPLAGAQARRERMPPIAPSAANFPSGATDSRQDSMSHWGAEDEMIDGDSGCRPRCKPPTASYIRTLHAVVGKYLSRQHGSAGRRLGRISPRTRPASMLSPRAPGIDAS